MSQITNIHVNKLAITNGAQQYPNKQIIPKIDYLPPNNFVFIATMQPIMKTIIIIVGNMKSALPFVAL